MSATDIQVGGDHYKRFKIQPIEYIEANEMEFSRGNIIKYATRLGYKGTPAQWEEDRDKIKHYADLLYEEQLRAHLDKLVAKKQHADAVMAQRMGDICPDCEE